MQFAVGYQQREDGRESMVEIVRDYADRVAEIYFPWVGSASDRKSTRLNSSHYS